DYDVRTATAVSCCLLHARTPSSCWSRRPECHERGEPIVVVRRGRGSLSAEYVLQRFHAHQHLARLGAVRRPEDPRVMQLIDDARGAAVADTQSTLQQ